MGPVDGGSRISQAEVEHVARLARLALSEAETARMRGQLDAILQELVAAGDVQNAPGSG